MRHRQAPRGHHLHPVSQAQLESKIPAHAQDDDLAVEVSPLRRSAPLSSTRYPTFIRASLRFKAQMNLQMNQIFGKNTSATEPRFTTTQGQYLAFIYAYTRVLGRPPAEADMQRYFKVTAPSVHQMVLTLE